MGGNNKPTGDDYQQHAPSRVGCVFGQGDFVPAGL
jgi:hypothetical protein